MFIFIYSNACRARWTWVRSYFAPETSWEVSFVMLSYEQFDCVNISADLLISNSRFINIKLKHKILDIVLKSGHRFRFQHCLSGKVGSVLW